MQNTAFRSGPVALTNTYTTNLLNPGTTTGGVGMSSGGGYASLFIIVRKYTFINKTAGAVTVRMYLGATGANTAGTELEFDVSIPANSRIERFCYLRLDTADFLVGGAAAGTSINVEFEGEIGVTK